MEDLDALLSDLETTTSHMPRSGAPKERSPEPLTSPLPYGHQPQMGSGESSESSGEKDHLYSTVCKPRSPKSATPVAPPFSSSSGVLGTGLCELDRLLQELNATQFNITDEIMSQFPSSKETAGEQKEDQSEDKKRPSLPPSPSPILPKPSATSATLELDKLMASLSDFCVQNHVVTALGRAWHPEHFVCGGCATALGGSSFFEKDGAPFCPECYFERFSPRCGLCNQPIRHKMVTALGTHWHPEHFCCVSCGEPIGDEGFHEREGRPYCRRDFLQLFAPRCQGCQGPILDNYISALSALWHPDCFVCRECFAPFSGGSFFEHDGRPLCENHFHARRGSLCAACGLPVTGRCVSALGRRFHPDHFTCTFCLRPLTKGSFQERAGKPYCQPCFFKLFG
ncbi:transforming growth factor beta-1-induced transcript 1 protein isoform X4 [Manis pentadactyla]|uniref:transforming growth factor beta-1-induced transcript 1 protein isoform X4 n=1 Tax=Manis pentadactyla TaxID=143292 RepID=UPI0018740555|nr:transforming growth factor beta-1-induced transcript 1 protein isoform X4 [Manis pentadactyla]